MTELSVLHPALDGHDDVLLQHETRAVVVGLSEARSDLLHRAAEAGRRVLLVTDERSVLTQPFHDALLGTGGVWVVREAAGLLRDGVTGRRLSRLRDALAEPGPLTPDVLSPVFLRQVPDAGPATPAWARDDVVALLSAPSTRQVNVSLSVRHAARRTTILGRAVEILLDALAGTSPTSWGTREPALVPWDRSSLTAYARGRAPQDTRLVVVGPGAVGTVLVRRTADGLEETTHLALASGAPGSAAARAVIDRVPAAFTAVARALVPLFGLALVRTARADLNVPPVVEAPSVPLAMLLGPPGVRELSLDLAEAGRRFGGTRVGRDRLPGLLLPLGDAEYADWGRMTEVLRWIGPDRVLRAVGGQDSVAAHGPEHASAVRRGFGPRTVAEPEGGPVGP